MQDIDHRCLEDKANDILTAIVHGMKKEEPSNHVRPRTPYLTRSNSHGQTLRERSVNGCLV